MSAGDWIGLGALIATLIGLIWGAFTWLMNVLLQQSRDTITELKEDRDELRDENKDLRRQLHRGGQEDIP